MDPGGPNWLMTGSSRGHLTLWDMRFQLAVNSTQMAQVLSALPLLAASAMQLFRLPARSYAIIFQRHPLHFGA